MLPISTTENGFLEFKPSVGESTLKTKIQSAKVGWIHSISDEPGASFDIVIKDGLGRIKKEIKNCSSENEKFGQLINMPTLLGEELEVSIENLKGAKSVKLFLN